MAKENRGKKIKWLMGISFTVLFFYYSIDLMRQEFKLGLFLLIGWALGYAVSRSEIGLSSGFAEFFTKGSSPRLNGLLVLFGLGALSAIIVHYIHYSNGAVPNFRAASNQSVIPGTSAVVPVNFGLIVGSFIFGVGLTLNSGCGLGTLQNIGQGNLRYIWTLFFLIIGTIPGQWVSYHLDQSVIHDYGFRLYLPDVFGYRGTFLFIFFTLIFIVFLTKKHKQIRKRKGTYQSTESNILTDSYEETMTASLRKKLFFT